MKTIYEVRPQIRKCSYPFMETRLIRKPDFGAWLKRLLKMPDEEIHLTEVSRLSGIAYPNLNAIVNSGAKGKPIQPEEPTMEKIIPALLSLRLIDSPDEAWIAAGYFPDGYKVVHESSSSYQSNEITYELDPDTLALAEGYNGLPDMARRIVDSAYKSASELALAMDREGVKGKRSED